MPVFTSVLCAIDDDALAPRVLRHAAGLAGACGARLTVMSAVHGDTARADARVRALLAGLVPGGAAWLGEPAVHVTRLSMGQPADSILGMARHGVDLLVTGTHSKSGLSRWLLGSTSAAVLEQPPCPTLLVPPGDLEVVAFDAGTARLQPGTVLAAVDLGEQNQRQVVVAAQLAALAGAPLVLMTVAEAGMSSDVAENALRGRAAMAEAGAVDQVVVRRGLVPDEIDAVAIAQHAGLVVMGVRQSGPGEIATAVLKKKDAVVLAVPAGR